MPDPAGVVGKQGRAAAKRRLCFMIVSLASCLSYLERVAPHLFVHFRGKKGNEVQKRSWSGPERERHAGHTPQGIGSLDSEMTYDICANRWVEENCAKSK